MFDHLLYFLLGGKWSAFISFTKSENVTTTIFQYSNVLPTLPLLFIINFIKRCWVMFNQENGLSKMLRTFIFFSSFELTMPTLVCFIWLFFPKSTCRNDTIGNQCEKRIHAIVNNTQHIICFLYLFCMTFHWENVEPQGRNVIKSSCGTNQQHYRQTWITIIHSVLVIEILRRTIYRDFWRWPFWRKYSENSTKI